MKHGIWLVLTILAPLPTAVAQQAPPAPIFEYRAVNHVCGAGPRPKPYRLRQTDIERFTCIAGRRNLQDVRRAQHKSDRI
jgi:hypothetical protein